MHGFFLVRAGNHKPLWYADLQRAFDVARPRLSGRVLTCHLSLVTCHFFPTRIHADGHGFPSPATGRSKLHLSLGGLTAGDSGRVGYASRPLPPAT
jgi:hypothetical protein